MKCVVCECSTWVEGRGESHVSGRAVCELCFQTCRRFGVAVCGGRDAQLEWRETKRKPEGYCGMCRSGNVDFSGHAKRCFVEEPSERSMLGAVEHWGLRRAPLDWLLREPKDVILSDSDFSPSTKLAYRMRGVDLQACCIDFASRTKTGPAIRTVRSAEVSKSCPAEFDCRVLVVTAARDRRSGIPEDAWSLCGVWATRKSGWRVCRRRRARRCSLCALMGRSAAHKEETCKLSRPGLADLKLAVRHWRCQIVEQPEPFQMDEGDAQFSLQLCEEGRPLLQGYRVRRGELQVCSAVMASPRDVLPLVTSKSFVLMQYPSPHPLKSPEVAVPVFRISAAAPPDKDELLWTSTKFKLTAWGEWFLSK